MFENWNKKSVIASLVAVLTLAIVVVAGYFVTSRETVELSIPYEDEETGISFSYPYEWTASMVETENGKQFYVERGVSPRRHQIIITVENQNYTTEYKPGKEATSKDKATYEAVIESIEF